MKVRLGDRTVDATLGPDIDLDEETVTLDGTRLTEAGAERLADDISRRHTGVGRTAGGDREG